MPEDEIEMQRPSFLSREAGERTIGENVELGSRYQRSGRAIEKDRVEPSIRIEAASRLPPGLKQL